MAVILSGAHRGGVGDSGPLRPPGRGTGPLVQGFPHEVPHRPGLSGGDLPWILNRAHSALDRLALVPMWGGKSDGNCGLRHKAWGLREFEMNRSIAIREKFPLLRDERWLGCAGGNQKNCTSNQKLWCHGLCRVDWLMVFVLSCINITILLPWEPWHALLE